MNNVNLLKKISLFYFLLQSNLFTLIILFLLIHHNSLFVHMLRSPQRSHCKTHYSKANKAAYSACEIISLRS